MSINKAIVIGRLGQDPEVKFMPTGQAVCNFSVATSESWTDKSGVKQERTEWHRITVWGKLGELCGEYLAKGRQVYVEGKLQTRSWDDKDGKKMYSTEIHGQNVQFLGSAPGAQANQGQQAGQSQQANQGQQSQQAQPQGQHQPNVDANFTADDIPF